jgi:urea transport system permease protein
MPGPRRSLLAPLYQATPRRGWIALSVVALAAFVVVPVLHLAVPPQSPLHLSDYTVALAGKLACYALVAVALDLVWGQAGILSLGHGLFFALGGYAFGMYLMRAIGHDGVYQSDLPDFMVFLDWKRYPWYWAGTQHAAWALLLVVLVPGLLAFVFGWFAFRARIRGVYLSIITQALTYAAMLLFFRNETGFGGNNGFTDFKRIFGFPIAAPGTRVALCAASVAALLGTIVLCRWLVASRFGRVLRAIRDGESRIRALGYEPLWYKLFAWTLSAVICGVAGALYVPQVGIINPSEMSTANSIEIAIWVAVGGRGTLVGAVIGAVAVNLAKSWFTVAFPTLWLFFLGLIFVAVTLLLPDGLVGLAARLRRRARPAPTPAPSPAAPAPAPASARGPAQPGEEVVA